MFGLSFDSAAVQERALYGAGSAAADYLGSEPSGLAIDFTQDNALVRGHSSNYSGNVGGLLTTTRASTAYYYNSSGVLTSAANNVLRLDHNPVTLDPLGVLVEEQRTNLLLQSETFGTTWSNALITIGSNAQASPDGTSTADTLTTTNSSASSGVSQTFTATAAAHTFSVYAKKIAGEGWLRMVLTTSASATDRAAWFDLNTGVVGTKQSSVTTSSIQNVGNGWYRCSMTVTTAAAVETAFIRNASADSGGVGSVGQSTAVWGAQAEAGAFPTSYIPTVASQVTRAADQISLATSAFPWIAAATTVIGRYSPVFIDTGGWTAPLFGLAGGATEYVDFTSNTTSTRTGRSYFRVRDDVGGQLISENASDNIAVSGAEYGVAAAYDASGVMSATNGALSPAVAAPTTLPTLSTLHIGQAPQFGSLYANGHIKKLKYLPRRASNAELQTMST